MKTHMKNLKMSSLLFLFIGCGDGDTSVSDKCRAGGPDISVRDVCYCMRAIGCERAVNCNASKYASVDACTANSPGTCDRLSDVKQYGSGVASKCIEVLEVSTCQEYKGDGGPSVETIADRCLQNTL